MAKILFLGTGGGRINLLRQLRGTGGFLVRDGGAIIHVDPGPGALFALNSLKIDPLSIGAAIVTHAHIDHMHDAPLILEAMSRHMTEKKGVLIASKYTVQGDETGDRAITLYHQSMLRQNIVLAPGVEKKVEMPSKGGACHFKITGTPVRHEDGSGFGFVMEIGGTKIGYTSDTEYFKELPAHFIGCNVLIANNIKGADDPYTGHLDSASCARLFSEAKPQCGIISHMGMKLLASGPEAEAMKISEASGVKVIAARDGFEYDTDGGKWGKYSAQKGAEKNGKLSEY